MFIGSHGLPETNNNILGPIMSTDTCTVLVIAINISLSEEYFLFSDDDLVSCVIC